MKENDNIEQIHFKNFDYSSKEMENLISEMLGDGFRVLISTDSIKVNWAKFYKNNKLGYVQDNKFGGFSLSVSYKPSRENGSGWRKLDKIYTPKLSHAKEVLNSYYAGEEYKDLNEFIQSEKVLTYVELYSDDELLNLKSPCCNGDINVNSYGEYFCSKCSATQSFKQ